MVLAHISREEWDRERDQASARAVDEVLTQEVLA